jgi:hypothetical protein
VVNVSALTIGLLTKRCDILIFVSIVFAALCATSLSLTRVMGAVGSDFTFAGGIPNSCSGVGALLLPVIANVTNTDSSQGSLSIQGIGIVSNPANNPNPTIAGSTNYFFPLSFPFSVSPHTPITATITVYSGLNFTGTAITRSLTWDCTTGAPVSTVGIHQCGITDGRLNCWPEMEAHPFAVYCEAGTVVVYAIDKQGVGTLAFKVSKEELDALDPKPATNTLITEALGVALYRLSSGELQVNGSKDTFFIWKNC